MDLSSHVLKLVTPFLFILGFLHRNIFAVEPKFDVPVVNITVVTGKTAILPCSVEYLGGYKVVWTDQWSTLLTLESRRIIDDERVGIDRPYKKDWNLIIHDVTSEDSGRYTCQINTQPVKTKAVMLVVLVPPKILESSSGDIKLREGETVTLTCNVTGVPAPIVQWYRRPFSDPLGTYKERLRTSIQSSDLYKKDDLAPDTSCFYTIRHSGVNLSGETLIIHDVSRYCDGIYECVAFNDVEPAVNREMRVNVEFAPNVYIKTPKLGQYIGKETILECDVVALPQAYSVWIFQGKELTSKKGKRRLDVYRESEKFITLSIRLLNLTREDFGEYTCLAENHLGRDKKSMFLYETKPIPPPQELTTRRMILGQATVNKNIQLNDDSLKDQKYFREDILDGQPVSAQSNPKNKGHSSYSPGKYFTPLLILTLLFQTLR